MATSTASFCLTLPSFGITLFLRFMPCSTGPGPVSVCLASSSAIGITAELRMLPPTRWLPRMHTEQSLRKQKQADVAEAEDDEDDVSCCGCPLDWDLAELSSMTPITFCFFGGFCWIWVSRLQSGQPGRKQ